FYWMVAAHWPPRLISFVMALPAGVGAFFLGKILLLLFRDLPAGQRWGYPILALAIGVTASGPVSLLGSTMNDWPGAALVMIALWLLLQRGEDPNAHWRALAIAGVIAGIASGLKLTNATYAVGLCVALLAQPPIVALLAWLVRRARHRHPPQAATADAAGKWRLVLVFWAASFVVWARMHAIYRYIMPLELLSGAVLLYVLGLIVPRRWLPPAAAVGAALAMLTTIYPAWGRIDYGEDYFVVTVPPVAPHAVILLLADEPMAFVLPFF